MSSELSVQTLAKEFDISESMVKDIAHDLGLLLEGDLLLAETEEVSILREMLDEKRGSKVIRVSPSPTPRELSEALGVKVQDIQKTLMLKMKVMAQLATALQQDVAEKLAKEYGYEIEFGSPEPKKPVAKPSPTSRTAAVASTIIKRPPVVTILGHVDHGKTSLLDYIRKANVAAKEFGGITQHIGAYQVAMKEGVITFLDTPGHAAFTAMRARGAQVTDIAILVVAADDGIMPQTIEAIGHVQNAEVPMIVAVNKCDKPGANPERVLQQLTEHNVIAESYGGQTITCNVSALTGEGIPNLLEMILLQADVMDLKADPRAPVKGVVIEAKLDRGRGPVATLLVQEGTLKVGQSVVVGTCYGKIKAMTDYLGARLNEAGPSTPVEILGLNEVPGAGESMEVAEDERAARTTAEARVVQERQRQLGGGGKRTISLRDIKRQMEQEGLKTLNLVVKADVQGSVEAVKGLLEKVQNEEVEVKVIYSGVGAVTESDVLLASAANAIIVGFNVKPEGKSKAESERQKVEIRTYSIIYELIEDIEAAVKGMLEPKFEEQHLGTVEIRLVFKLTKQGFVAGCYVTEGQVKRGSKCRVHRDKELVYEGAIDSLKHIKQDVREMTMGQECGIQFENWTAFKEGDVIEAYEMVQVN